MVNLKKIQLVLEQGDLWVISPLGLKGRRRYVETIRGGMAVEGLDRIYKVTTHTEDYINPIVDGNLSKRSISSCTSNFDEGLENWQQRLHEVFVRICARITKSMCWVGTKVCELPLFDGLSDVEILFVELEIFVVEQKRILALDASLRDTPARWWAAHKNSIQDWSQCKRLIKIRFGETSEYVSGQYSGKTNPREHIITCGYIWNELPKEDWPHMFIHTLDNIPKNW